MAKRLNYPTQQQPQLQAGELSEKISFIESLSDWKFTNDPVKVRSRVNWFFDQCARADTRPTVALLAVALNTSRQTMWQWEQKGGELGEIISQAKRILNALLEDWSITGKINPVAAVWLQKNHFGYTDTRSYTVEAKPVQQLTASMTPEEIAQRIEQDIPVDPVEEEYTADVIDGN